MFRDSPMDCYAWRLSDVARRELSEHSYFFEVIFACLCTRYVLFLLLNSIVILQNMEKLSRGGLPWGGKS